MASESEDEGDAALSCEKLFSTRLPSVLPFPVGRKREFVPLQASKKGPAATAITTAAWSSSKQRLYVGLSNGDVCFFSLERDGAQHLKYVGSHKGPVSCLCMPKRQDGELGASGLLLSGSVDGNIKIWDYQGKVGSEPTVCVQTLYGHSGTITGLFTYGDYILSSSTDKTVKVWRAVQGREQLVYPWYNLQATALTLSEWVRHMSYDRSKEVGDLGSFFAVDEAGGVVRIVPHSVHDLDDRTNKGFVFSVPGMAVPQPGVGHMPAVPSATSVGHGSGSAPNSSSSYHVGGVPHAIPVTHDRGVLMVRYVADWHLLLTLCYDNCLRAYHSDTGEVRHTWANETRCLFLDLEVDVEYKEVLAVDEQGVLSIFSIKAGALLATKTVATSRVVKITQVLGRHMYAIMTESELSVWHLNHELDYNLLRGGHMRAVISLYACTGGSGAQPNDRDYRIFSAGMDNTVRLWDPYDMACVRVHDEAHSEITAMTFYEAWNILVTGHDNGDIRLWDLDTGPWAVLQQHNNSVTSLVMAMIRKNEELLISGSYDGMVVLWDVRTLRNEPPHMIAKFRAHGLDPGKVPAMVASAAKVAGTSPLLGAKGASTTGAPPDPTPPDPTKIETLIPALTHVDSSLSHSGAGSKLYSACWREGEQAAGGADRPGSAASATTGAAGGAKAAGDVAVACKEEMGGHTITVTLVAPDAGGGAAMPANSNSMLAGAGGATSSSTLDLLLARSRAVAALQDLEELQQRQGRGEAVGAGPGTAGGEKSPALGLSTVGVDRSGASGAVCTGHLDVQALEPEVLVVCFDPIKKMIITGGNDHMIKVWATNGYQQVGQHVGHTDAVTSMTLDANLLFSGSEDCTIRVWDTVPATLRPEPSSAAALLMQPSSMALLGLAQPLTSTLRADQPFVGHSLKVLTGHTRCVTGLDMSPHGGHLVSCSLDGSLRLWDYVAGVALTKFTHHEEMRCLALRTDKAEVLVGTNQASILRYSIDTVMPARAGSPALALAGVDLAAGLNTLLGMLSGGALPASLGDSLLQGSNHSGTAGSASSRAGARHAQLSGGSHGQSPLTPSAFAESSTGFGDEDKARAQGVAPQHDSSPCLGDVQWARAGEEDEEGGYGSKEEQEDEGEEDSWGHQGTLHGKKAGWAAPRTSSRSHGAARVAPGDWAGTRGSAGGAGNNTSQQGGGEAAAGRLTELFPQGLAVTRGQVFGGVATTVAKSDLWRWGTAKLQLLPKEPPKLSATEMLVLLDKQRMNANLSR